MTVESRSGASDPSGVQDPRRLAWAYLSKVVQGPCPALSRLVEEVGPEEAARAVRERDLSEMLGERTIARAHVDTAAHDLELVAGDGWPARDAGRRRVAAVAVSRFRESVPVAGRGARRWRCGCSVRGRWPN